MDSNPCLLIMRDTTQPTVPQCLKFGALVTISALRSLHVSVVFYFCVLCERINGLKLLGPMNSYHLFIDVGANIGKVSKLVLENTNNLNVVCYEPHKEIYQKLSENLKNEKRCKIFQYAVGSRIEDKVLFDWKEYGTGFASFYKDSIKQVLLPTYGKISLDYEDSVKVITLDSINYEKKIEFIKIDVEGNELEVLKGARDSIKNHEPKYILLEFNEANVHSRVFMKDLINLLDGYSLYRIMPGGKILELNNPYNAITHEIFGTQNIIFINDNKK